jgi:hypothetical protein
MGKAKLLAGILIVAFVLPVSAAQRIGIEQCRTKVTQDSRYMQGTRSGRLVCARGCRAAIQRCMHSGGKFD